MWFLSIVTLERMVLREWTFNQITWTYYEVISIVFFQLIDCIYLDILHFSILSLECFTLYFDFRLAFDTVLAI